MVEESSDENESNNKIETYAVNVSDSLNDFVSNVTIDGKDATQGSFTILPNTEYNLGITFKESDELQFNHDSDNLIYTFPNQVTLPDSNDSILLHLTDREGQAYDVNAFYEIRDNKLYIKFDSSDSNYQKLINTDNVYLNLNLKFKLNNNTKDNEIVWGADKKTTIEIDSNKDVSIEKIGTYDKKNSRFNYIVKVKSTGYNENIVVKDELKGSAISFNKDVTVTSSTGQKVNGVLSDTDSGFTYTIPSMSNGEEVTFYYSANIDYSKLSNNEQFTVDETKNDVSVKADDVPEKKASKDFSHETKYNSISKSGKLSEDKKTITWTIVVNEDAKVSVGGSNVTDTLIKNDKVPMAYIGQGITVQRYNSKGEKVGDSFIVNWNDLSSFDKESSWKYTLPNDKESYKYIITYTTSVDNSKLIDNVEVKNKVEDDENHTSEGKVNVLPGDTFDVKKTNKGINEDGTVDYTVKVTIPKNGFNQSFVVTDYLPKENSNQYKDSYVQNSLKVKLDDKELQSPNDFDVTYLENNRYTNAKLQLTFKNIATLFSKSDKERVLTITYKVQANMDWLGEHYNTVQVNADGKNRSDTNKFILTKQSISKSGESKGNYDNTGLPMYHFYIQLEGVQENSVTVDDRFDKDLLELIDDGTVLVGASDLDWEAKQKNI